MIHRTFPIKSLQSTEPEYYGDDHPADLDNDQKKQRLFSVMSLLCPEKVCLKQEVPDLDDAPSGNIRVRHVQPMAPGKHDACANLSSIEPDFQSRRSLTLLRKALFEQTCKIIQSSSKSILVYDVMDDEVAKSFSTNDKYIFLSIEPYAT